MNDVCNRNDCFNEGDYHYYVETHDIGIIVSLCREHKDLAFEIDPDAEVA